jgi:glycosyltransferase involved in cell wall biosynthesis
MISAVILTHNDEKSLLRCLKGVSWCDEVIVIDDESTDNTEVVAKECGANVYTRALRDDFAAQRNFGLEKAKEEWVLFVDSDEVVPNELAGEIQSLLSSRGSASWRRRGDLFGLPAGKAGIASPSERSRNDIVNGYFIKRSDWWGGRWLRHGEMGNVKLLRLARKDAGKWEQPVHEQWKVNGFVGGLASPLLHYPHSNVAQFLDEINRYSTVYARFLYSQGVKEPVWYIVAKPFAKFFINYFRRFGFLDGTPGIIVALMMSFHSFLVRSKLWHLRQKLPHT